MATKTGSRCSAVGTAVLLAVLATAAQAQGGDVAFQLRLGGVFPRGDGVFWKDVEDTFSLSVSDLNGAIVGTSFIGSFTNHLEVGFNLDVYSATAVSSVRGWVDGDGFPIEHDTSLTLAPVTVDLRIVPAGRYKIRGPQGRRVRQPVFYLGGGVGFQYWEYEEVGDFVDFTDQSIFYDRFVDSGWAFEAHALAGLELPFGRTWSLMFEGRYSWSEATPGGPFEGLGDLDLGGFAAYVGASWRF